MIEVNKDIVIYAFRYALGRRSYAPTNVMSAINKNLHLFNRNDIEQMIYEIDECHDLGMEMDIRSWKQFQDTLKTYIKEVF